MTLPADIARCQGIAPDWLPCEIRHKCERYLALMDVRTSPERLMESRFLCLDELGRANTEFPFFIPADGGAE